MTQQLLITGSLFLTTFAATGLIHVVGHALGFPLGFWFAFAMLIAAVSFLGWYRWRVLRQRAVQRRDAHWVAAVAGLGLGAVLLLAAITTIEAESQLRRTSYADNRADVWVRELGYQIGPEGALPWLAAVWIAGAGAVGIGAMLSTSLPKPPST